MNKSIGAFCCLVLAVMCSSVARAGDFDDAMEAYERGAYATVLKISIIYLKTNNIHSPPHINCAISIIKYT